MTTLKDISMLAGVSLSTVSRTLSGSCNVDPELRQRVLAAAKQLDYTPNLAARSLRTRSTRLIGMISEGNTNYMFSNLINHISDQCTDLGYCLIVANHHNDPEREELIFSSMRQRGVDGLILSLVSKESNIIPRVVESDIPVVIFDRYLIFDQLSMGENNYSITLDNYRAGQMAAEFFLQQGHKKIALAEGPKDVDLTRMRTTGFFDRLAGADSFVPMPYRFSGGFEFEDGVRVARELTQFPEQQRPSAIWCQNDSMAAGLISELHRFGLRIPEDLSVLGMDNIELSTLIYPSLSTIEQPFREMANVSVRMLLGRKTPFGKKAILSPRLLERESTRPFSV